MRIVIILISLISIPFSAYGALPTTIIQSCYDSDTRTTTDWEKIRLAWIDTPELEGKKAEPAKAKEARDFLNAYVANREVNIRWISTDRYGRTLAELFRGNINIQKLLVDKGYGQIYRKYANQCEWSK